MQLSDQPDKIPLAFAENGEKDVIPEGSSPFDGRASLNDGFPPETRQARIDGGIPPSGLDTNGILWLATAINRWQSAGGFFVYDNDFATDTNVDGYPKGAMLVRADGTGFWVSTADNNTTDPDAGGAGWQPVNNVGVQSISMAGSNVTLTALQAARDVIVVSGTLSANVNLIFPATVKQWLVANNTTGAYTLTCKTASGTGGLVTQGTSRVFYGDGTNLYGVNPLASTQSQVDTGADTSTFLTPKTFKDSSLRAVKASQVEVDAGTNDDKFITPKGFKDSSLRAVKASQAETNTGTNDDKFLTAKTFNDSDQLAGKAALGGDAAQAFLVAPPALSDHATPWGAVNYRIPKAMASFNGTSGTYSNFNFATISRAQVGGYDLAFANPMSTNTYLVFAMACNSPSSGYSVSASVFQAVAVRKTTSGFSLIVGDNNTDINIDADFISVIVFELM